MTKEEILKKRDELAGKFISTCCYRYFDEDFIEGFNACMSLMEEREGTFIAYLKTISEHLCGSKADSPCDQMIYQDLAHECLRKTGELK